MRQIIRYLFNRPKLLVIIVVGLIWIFIKATSNYGTEPISPQIVIKDANLCSSKNNIRVPVGSFYSSDEQGVCAQVESDVSPIRLTLLIEQSDNTFQTEYADAQEFSNGPVYFHVSPKLPIGKYTARIMYARRTLAELDFDVLKK